MKGKAWILSAAIMLLVFSAGVSRAQFDFYTDSELPYVSIMTYASSTVHNAFAGSGSAMNAYVYRINVSHVTDGSKPANREIRFRRIAFDLTAISGITPSSAGEIRLVMDMNGNGKPDADDNVIAVSSVNFAEKIIFFTLDEPLEYGASVNFFVVGDFFSLTAGAELDIKLSDRFVLIEDTDTGKPLRVSTTSIYETWHHEGNSAPLLVYSRYLKDGHKGVWPDNGKSGDAFTFEAVYTDRDGDIARSIELHIDLNGNGVFEPNERIVMEAPYPSVAADNQRYGVHVRITAPRSGKMMYRFVASDGKDEAMGEATEIAYLRINAALAITDARVMSKAIVPGEKFDVAYTVRYFFESVKVKWESAGEFKMSPFASVGIVHKDRHALDLMYDEETLILSLRAPESLDTGLHSIPVIAVSAQWYDVTDQTEKPVETFAPDVSASIVPLRVEIAVTPSRAALTIADEISVALVIISKPDVQLVSDPESELKFLLSDEGAVLALARELADGMERRIYTAVIHPTAPTGVSRRTRIITPLYKIEYRMPGDDTTHVVEVPERSVTFMPILSTEEATGLPLIFPRRAIASEFRFGTQAIERSVTIAMYGIGAIAVSAILIPLCIVVYSGAANGLLYRRIVARSLWLSCTRMLRHAQGNVSDSALAGCEHSFRRYLAYVYGCSEDEAQSVMLWHHVEASPHSAMIKGAIRSSLEYFRALSDRSSEEHDMPNLIKAQRNLRKLI